MTTVGIVRQGAAGTVASIGAMALISHAEWLDRFGDEADLDPAEPAPPLTYRVDAAPTEGSQPAGGAADVRTTGLFFDFWGLAPKRRTHGGRGAGRGAF